VVRKTVLTCFTLRFKQEKYALQEKSHQDNIDNDKSHDRVSKRLLHFGTVKKGILNQVQGYTILAMVASCSLMKRYVLLIFMNDLKLTSGWGHS
jgi:hypothetical protein